MNLLPLVDRLRGRLGHRFPPLGRFAFDLAFRLLPPKGRVELFPGVLADLDFADSTQRGTYWQGERFEHPTALVLRDWMRSGATHFFDIGSNYGFFSHWLLSQNETLQVHAFEPNPKTFAVLESIRTLNDLMGLRTWNLGLSDAPGQLVLQEGQTDSGHSTFGINPELSGSGRVTAEVLPFETWRERAGLAFPASPRWIAKIDVEGFEERVLQGLRPALAARAFVGLVIEINTFTLEFCGSSPERVRSLLAEAGYRPVAGLGEGSGNEFFVPA